MKILNFGSLNIDYVYSVDNFVRPGETISSTRMEKFFGGKGLNQSIALARAGAEVYHAGCIGHDGQRLMTSLQSSGVNTKYIYEAECPTGHAIIQLDKKGQNCILLYEGANKKITEELADKVISNFDCGDIIVLQNEISNLQYIFKRAAERKMQIVFNPSPINKAINQVDLSLVKYLVLNEVEGEELSGLKKPEDIVIMLYQKYSCTVVLTLGKDGVIFYDGEQIIRQGIYNTAVKDTTAAGDTFTGYFIACIAKGAKPEEALKIASMAAALAVSTKGASNSIPLLKDVLKSLELY